MVRTGAILGNLADRWRLENQIEDILIPALAVASVQFRDWCSDAPAMDG